MNYGANDIVSLSAGKAFRSKIGMYLSADKQEAINLGLRELIVNVQDEYEVYKPKDPFLRIELDSSTHKITVSDNMRGIPVGIRDDGINSLTAAFLIPHSGGKHTEGVYSSAVGINGEGNKIVCHTAQSLSVKVFRDNKVYSQSFQSNDEGAYPVSDVIEEPFNQKTTGTIISYIPDPLVYGLLFIDLDPLRKLLKEVSMFSPGLKIELLIDDEKPEVFRSNNGLIDGLNNKNAVSKPFSYHYETEDCKVDLALQWVSNKGEIRGYANNLYMPDGGAFIVGFKSSLTRTFNSLAKTKYDGDTIRNVLDGFVSVKVKMGQFTNQQKTSLANPEARTAASNAISNALKEFQTKRESDFEKVTDLLNKVSRAEVAAERARAAVLESQKSVQKEARKPAVLAGSLNDCREHGTNSQLIIVEGKSAGGSLINARDSRYTAIIPLRGKPINVLKNSIEDALENEEVQSLMKALGCGYGDSFNPKKLRYGRVVICADADYDGYSIMCLLLVLFYHFYPELIKEGYLYWGRAPLYKISAGKKTYYAYDDEELSKLPKGDISRMKGLGEATADDFVKTLFSPEGRYVRFTMNDVEKAKYFFNMLLGKEVSERREYIFENVDFEGVEE